MVDITRVDRCAAVEQVARDLDRRGKVQRRLTVAAARVHQVGVGGDQFRKAI